MRSRAEWLLRAAALAALGLLIWATVRPKIVPALTAARGTLERTLVDATRRPVAVLALDIDSVPGPAQRDWLAAIRAAGTAVTWRARGLQPVALAAAPVPEPEHRVRLVVASPDSADAVLSDGLGPIDTIALRGAPSSTLLRTATGTLSASIAGVRATTPAPGAVGVRRLLVLASAGWESKFVITALEEAGWTVDARIRVAPGIEISQGNALALDTARYSAVIALDAAAAPSGSAIDRYVSSGGGAILAGPATRVSAFARLTPATAGVRRLGEPRAGLALTGVRDDAVILESRAGGTLLAARRSGFGRIVASGYDETWTWRMSKAEDAAAAHREWWNALVSAVAYVPQRVAPDSGAVADPAPVAALTAALGPPSAMEETAAGRIARMPPTWLVFGILLVSILGEVVSRRLRGLA